MSIYIVQLHGMCGFPVIKPPDAIFANYILYVSKMKYFKLFVYSHSKTVIFLLAIPFHKQWEDYTFNYL